MENLWQDLYYGLRLMMQRPVFTAVTILTLALGIGATTTIFTVADAALFRPMPFKDAERLAEILNYLPEKKVSFPSLPREAIKEWRAQGQILEQVEGYDTRSFTMTGGEEPEQVQAAYTTPGLLPFLGVQPQFGRSFTAEDAAADGRVALLSYGLWQRRFGGEPSIIGKSITLNQQSYTIIGVLPSDFRFPDDNTKVWLPAPESGVSGPRTLQAITRVRKGLSLAQAQAQMDVISKRLDQEKPVAGGGWSVRLSGFEATRALMGHRKELFILLGAVGFLLLIACVNTANLMLAQSTVREREIAVRAALGASRPRLIRQLLTESVMLSLCGGLCGVLLALWGVDVMAKMIPREITFANYTTISMDKRVLFFALGLSLLTGILFGLIPAIRGSHTNLTEALKGITRSMTGTTSHRRWRNTLVVAEIGLSLVLLIGAGLLINSFFRLRHVNPGFKTENLLAVELQLPRGKYQNGALENNFFDQWADLVAGVPHVKAVTSAMSVPPQSGVSLGDMEAEGVPMTAADKNALLNFNRVSANYFSVIGATLLQGRAFTPQDIEDTPPVVILNQSLAKHFWPDGQAVGKRWRLGAEEKAPWLTVVGVVSDLKDKGTVKAVTDCSVYYPFASGKGVSRSRTLIVRAEGDPLSLVPAIKSQLWSLEKTQPINRINTVDHLFDESLAQPRFYLFLMSVFAGVALLLAAAGIYGVISYSVSQRTQEMGIRMALGAQPGNILKLIVGHGVALTLIGVGVGIAASFALTRLMASLLFEVSATDPWTFVGVTSVLVLVALAACYLPARRATKVDPMAALRHE